MIRIIYTISVLILVLLISCSGESERTKSERNQIRANDRSLYLGKQLPTEQIFRDLPSFNGFKDSTVYLFGARNEYVAFQIACVGINQKNVNLSVKAGSLTHTNKTESISSENIQTNFIGYIKTKKPYYGVSRVGYWPDPLLEDSVVNLSPGIVQPVWITVFIPEDAPGGNYVGELCLFSDNREDKRIKINLKVWNFSIPDQIHLPTAFLLWPKYISEYHKLDKGSNAYEDMLMKYFKSMLSHRIMPSESIQSFPGTVPSLKRIKNDGHVNYKRYEKKISEFLKLGQTAFNLGRLEPNKSQIPKVYGNISRFLEKQGWLKYFYAYMFDETYEDVQETYALVHQGNPQIRTLLTHTPDENLPDVDIWCPRITSYYTDFDKIEQFRAMGKKIWIYTAGNAETECPSHHLDMPLINNRIIPWICWKEKLDGYLFWAVNYWTVDPWKDAMVYPRQNGNGTFFYPGENGPISSIRLEAFRDGMEDYEYFYILRNLLGKLRVKSDKRIEPLLNFSDHLLQIDPNVINSVVSYTLSPEKYYIYRIVMGEFIDYINGVVEGKGESLALSPLIKKAILTKGSVIPGESDGTQKVLETVNNKFKKIVLSRYKPKHEITDLITNDFSGYDIMHFQVENQSDVNVKPVLIMKDEDGKKWSRELLIRSGDFREVEIKLPSPYLNLEKIAYLGFYVWKPAKARIEFSIGDINLKIKDISYMNLELVGDKLF